MALNVYSGCRQCDRLPGIMMHDETARYTSAPPQLLRASCLFVSLPAELRSGILSCLSPVPRWDSATHHPPWCSGSHFELGCSVSPQLCPLVVICHITFAAKGEVFKYIIHPGVKKKKLWNEKKIKGLPHENNLLIKWTDAYKCQRNCAQYTVVFLCWQKGTAWLNVVNTSCDITHCCVATNTSQLTASVLCSSRFQCYS